MHDGRSFLFQGKNPVRVRRRLPKERAEKARIGACPSAFCWSAHAPKTSEPVTSITASAPARSLKPSKVWASS